MYFIIAMGAGVGKRIDSETAQGAHSPAHSTTWALFARISAFWRIAGRATAAGGIQCLGGYGAGRRAP